MTKITVLIPSYNPGNYLKEAVNSVLAQSFSDWKLLIIDDHSTDESLKSVSNIKDERIKIIKNNENLGQASSLNIGLSKVDTPYFLQLDADDWLETHTLEVMVNKMANLPKKIAVLSGNIRMVWEETDGEIVRTKIRKGKRFRNKYKFLLSNSSVWPRLYRTSAVKEIGGWPTDGPFEGRYIEDLRILFRLIEKYDFYWIDEVLYNHRRHETNQTKEKKEMVETLEWLITSTLKRWGNHYKAVFFTSKGGYKKVVRLTPTRKRKSKQKINKRASTRSNREKRKRKGKKL